jgi:hypothetical protein
MTMYEVIKLKNAFSGTNKDEIKNEIENLLISGSYPKLEESEELYNKEMIKTINLMLNVLYLFNFFFYFVLFILFIYY